MPSLSSISRLFSNIFAKDDICILMVGLDDAGKTTLLYRLQLDRILTTTPTIGVNVETIHYNNTSFTIWDVGGQDTLRTFWKHYYKDTHGVIFVIDSGDRSRISIAREELQQLLRENRLRDTPLLVLANKQDLPYAMTRAEVTDILGLQAFAARRWHVQAISVRSGQGLYEGLEWLSTNIKRRRTSDRPQDHLDVSRR
ncbi:ADP-ribosylation factor [Leucogyrophana mollusca]|uniref:ADP-ribosylation factor n=1 Tax=Leucogyrophana mollusca TaxID=85980 RepID=A0ACB8B8Q4_9AGAM|nr:ADP-ribosylation factor [Leucogyrophana mollusca]